MTLLPPVLELELGVPSIAVEVAAPVVDIAADPTGAVVVGVAVPGPPGPPGNTSGTANRVTVSGNAATALSGHRVVRRLADGTLDYASNTTPAHRASTFAITDGAAAQGAPVTAVLFGLIVEPSWSFVPGPVFLGVDGALTQTAPMAPAFLAQVGTAVSVTEMFVQQQPSITLS